MTTILISRFLLDLREVNSPSDSLNTFHPEASAVCFADRIVSDLGQSLESSQGTWFSGAGNEVDKYEPDEMVSHHWFVFHI